MTHLYLIRHGETLLNAEGIYYGWTDCGLTTQGIAQAEGLAVHLAKLKFDAVIASPLARTKETALIVSRLNEEDIHLDDRLKELNFGDWEGSNIKDIQATYPAAWQAWVDDWRNSPPPHGESFVSLYERVKDALNDILTVHNGKTILIVSHQSCLRLITSLLLSGNDSGYWNFTFEHGSYSWLEVLDGHCTIRKINC